ncbi:MAG: hypothetical protein Q7R72_00840 [bacterium]|nr:hypothetical protein [bacterium]
MIFASRKIFSFIILLSLLTIVFFGFSLMTHGREAMTDNCPFSPISKTLCFQSTTASVIHHISAYYSFLNVPLYSSMTIFLSLFLIAVFLIFTFSVDYSLLWPVVLSRGRMEFSPIVSFDRKTIRWLSLFEHSPSIA